MRVSRATEDHERVRDVGAKTRELDDAELLWFASAVVLASTSISSFKYIGRGAALSGESSTIAIGLALVGSNVGEEGLLG